VSKITVNSVDELRAFIGKQKRVRQRQSFVDRFHIKPEFAVDVEQFKRTADNMRETLERFADSVNKGMLIMKSDGLHGLP